MAACQSGVNGHNGAMEQRHSPDAADSAVDFLRDRGERVTKARRAVLEVLANTDEHLTTDDIAARVAGLADGIHLATVYRALSTLSELGLVAHTHVGGGATFYQLEDPESEQTHAHAQCSECGTIIDIPVKEFRRLSQSLQLNFDFTLVPEHAALLGTCLACASNDSDDHGHAGGHGHGHSSGRS